VLIDHCMNDGWRMDAGQLVPGRRIRGSLNDRQRPMLPILGMATPPNDGEQLTGAEVINRLAAASVLLVGRHSEAKAVDLRTPHMP